MSKTQEFINDALRRETHQCFFWPFARQANGYGKLGRDGKTLMAHRVICEAANGPAPKRKPLALHSCGNGHLGCVNPAHLRWGTAKENTADAMTSGTFAVGERARKSALTAEMVLSMRERHEAGRTYQKIADDFGVSIASAHRAINRKSWAHV